MSNEKIKVQPVVTTSLKEHGLNEEWLKDKIANNPGMLGLARNVNLKGLEIQQSSGGRLDILLIDDDTERRYEVEIQLGATDPSHIIRTIEYWDVERKQDPDHEHCAVIVAEEITGRFFNVISLFNGQMPLIAIKLTAIEYSPNEIGLLFTRVLDETVKASSRETWEQEHGSEWVKCAKKLFHLMRPDSAETEPHYTSRYIAMQKDGRHILWLKYRTDAVHVEFACPARNHELEEELKNAGAKEPKYYAHVQPVQYRFNVPITADPTLEQLSAIVKGVLEGNNLGEQE